MLRDFTDQVDAELLVAWVGVRSDMHSSETKFMLADAQNHAGTMQVHQLRQRPFTGLDQGVGESTSGSPPPELWWRRDVRQGGTPAVHCQQCQVAFHPVARSPSTLHVYCSPSPLVRVIVSV